jgi:hypothetical protein
MRMLVDRAAPVGAELKGAITVEGIAASLERALAGSASLPVGVTGLRAGEIDASDNRDDFLSVRRSAAAPGFP